MARRWVLNASPLIVLARIGQADLFAAVADEVVVPQPVAGEIEAGPPDDPARQILAAGTFTVVEVPPSPPELMAWDLGAGETAVLSFARSHAGWTAILDDAAARRCARSFAIPVRGTLGIVIVAKQRGLVPSATSVLLSLKAAGLYLDDGTIREVLARTVKERWPV
jgi:predicted nucleic acid-binding protein